jgi:hypothetical protein
LFSLVPCLSCNVLHIPAKHSQTPYQWCRPTFRTHCLFWKMLYRPPLADHKYLNHSYADSTYWQC